MSLHHPSRAAWLALLLAVPALPQETVAAPAEPDPEQLVAILDGWADALSEGKIPPRVSVLRDLLDLARRQDGERAARAVLRIAGASHAQKLTGPILLEIRELGHWTLMRMRDPAAREVVLRHAAGEVDGEVARPVQVAAIKALGLRRDDEGRRILEARLIDADGQVRLAAAEALGSMRRRELIHLLTRAIRTERHPVVAQALVHAVGRTLRAHDADYDVETRRRAIDTILRRLGHAGWRTDLAIVELAERNSTLAAIPVLIRILEGHVSTDPLLEAVNAGASPILRQRAWRALRRLTGAILPYEDPAAWRQFWEEEQDRIVLPERPSRATAQIKTSSTFFGIPVTGREIAFIIDTSGSMKEEFETQDDRGRRRVARRIDVAKEQVLAAAHAMDPASRYHLLTFAGEVLTWNPRPVPPSPASYRALSEVVDQFDADGGTDLFGALMAILEPDRPFDEQDAHGGIDEIFVLTDGEPTGGRVNDPDAIVAIVAELNRYQRIRIHTVHIGTEKGVDLMRRLAEGNEGVFVRR